jgi:hypothetical protein
MKLNRFQRMAADTSPVEIGPRKPRSNAKPKPKPKPELTEEDLLRIEQEKLRKKQELKKRDKIEKARRISLGISGFINEATGEVAPEILADLKLTSEEFEWAYGKYISAGGPAKNALSKLMQGLIRARETGFDPNTEMQVFGVLFKDFKNPKVERNPAYAKELGQAIQSPPRNIDPEITEVTDGPPQRKTYHDDSKLFVQRATSPRLDTDQGLYNILAVLEEANPEEQEFYKYWYDIAHEQAKKIAAETGYPLEVVAGVIAIMSPGSKWEANLKAGYAIMNGSGIKGLGGFYPINTYKAVRLKRKSKDDLQGAIAEAFAGDSRKTFPFFQTLVDPVEAARKAVVDRHMIGIWYGNPKMNDYSPKPAIYARIQDDVRRAAEICGLSTQAVQAVTWVLWRNREDLGVQRPENEPKPNWIDQQRNMYLKDVSKIAHALSRTARRNPFYLRKFF